MAFIKVIKDENQELSHSNFQRREKDEDFTVYNLSDE
jgi:hypothetical protein